MKTLLMYFSNRREESVKWKESTIFFFVLFCFSFSIQFSFSIRFIDCASLNERLHTTKNKKDNNDHLGPNTDFEIR